VNDVCEGPVCITCSDQGEPATVIVSDGLEAQVRVGASDLRTVDVSLVDPVRAGDEVLLHAGVAIARLTPSDGRPGEVTT
jgi:hydrogenase maturation factor